MTSRLSTLVQVLGNIQLVLGLCHSGSSGGREVASRHRCSDAVSRAAKPSSHYPQERGRDWPLKSIIRTVRAAADSSGRRNTVFVG
jgi:hypothetical protein